MVHVLWPIKDNRAMNGSSVWKMALALHLFLHECFPQEVNKSETR